MSYVPLGFRLGRCSVCVGLLFDSVDRPNNRWLHCLTGNKRDLHVALDNDLEQKNQEAMKKVDLRSWPRLPSAWFNYEARLKM